MNTNYDYEEIKLDTPALCQYSGVAFDGKHYFFSEPNFSQVHEYNLNWELVRSYRTTRKYTSLCYDMVDNCFWAATKDCYFTVFKLDRNMVELERVYAHPSKNSGCIIVGLGFNYKQNKLLVAYTNCILECEKPLLNSVGVIARKFDACITNCGFSVHGYGYTYIKDEKQYVTFQNSVGKELVSFLIPQSWLIKGCLFHEQEQAEELLLLIQEGVQGSSMVRYVLAQGQESAVAQLERVEQKSSTEDSTVEMILQSVAMIELAVQNSLNADINLMEGTENKEVYLKMMTEITEKLKRTMKDLERLESSLFNKISLQELQKMATKGDAGANYLFYDMKGREH